LSQKHLRSLRVAAVNLRRLLALGLRRQGEAWALA
jgi:hypothetical protein